MESEKIVAAIAAIFTGADTHKWETVRASMAENVLLDYSSLSGSPAATLPSDQIIAAWKGFLPGFDRTHHQLSDFQVTRNGDKATVHFSGIADHYIDTNVWTVEGTYEAEAANINDLWLVTKLKFNLAAQHGDTGLPAMAVQKMNSQK